MAKVSLNPNGVAHGEVEALLIFGLDLVVNFVTIAVWFFFQDRRQGGAGVFRIDVDAACENGLLADKSSGEIKAALDGKMGFGFNLLGDDFCEDELFGEVLGADDYAVLARGPQAVSRARSATNMVFGGISFQQMDVASNVCTGRVR